MPRGVATLNELSLNGVDKAREDLIVGRVCELSVEEGCECCGGATFGQALLMCGERLRQLGEVGRCPSFRGKSGDGDFDGLTSLEQFLG